jgi:hypothetical protein
MTPTPTIMPLLVPEEVCEIIRKDYRSLARLTGGRKKRPQITYVRVGGELRFEVEAVMEFIAAGRVEADRPRCVQDLIEGMKREPAFERLVQMLVVRELREAKEAA